MLFWRVHLKRISNALQKPLSELKRIAGWALVAAIIWGTAYFVASWFEGVSTPLVMLFFGIVYLEQKIKDAGDNTQQEIKYLKNELDELHHRIRTCESQL